MAIIERLQDAGVPGHMTRIQRWHVARWLVTLQRAWPRGSRRLWPALVRRDPTQAYPKGIVWFGWVLMLWPWSGYVS